MTFYTFMMRNYKNSNSPAGDLARDMKRWHTIIYDHLVRNGACDACLETFEECWEEYVRCEKKKLKRN